MLGAIGLADNLKIRARRTHLRGDRARHGPAEAAGREVPRRRPRDAAQAGPP
ncbi:hypothetical protein LT493_26870 [Streptomyces tricolor]|nr:hypothetical protein [Streptomyces tricolor]